MKRLSIPSLLIVVASLVALPIPTSADPVPIDQPFAEITSPLSGIISQPNFNIQYHAESNSAMSASRGSVKQPAAVDPLQGDPDALDYVELHYRYIQDFCTYTDWTTWPDRDYTANGQYIWNGTFAFAAPVQGVYEFAAVAVNQSGATETNSVLESTLILDYSDPTIGGTNPLDGAVVSGNINISAFFDDSWGLRHVGINLPFFFFFFLGMVPTVCPSTSCRGTLRFP